MTGFRSEVAFRWWYFSTRLHLGNAARRGFWRRGRFCRPLSRRGELVRRWCDLFDRALPPGSPAHPRCLQLAIGGLQFLGIFPPPRQPDLDHLTPGKNGLDLAAEVGQ